MTPKPLLQVEKLTYEYPQDGRPAPILRDVSFDLGVTETLSILGASGIGKTTLCRLMAGLLTPTSGVVRLAGEPVDQPGSRITIAFQHYPCFPWLTVEGNLLFGLRADPTLNTPHRRDYALWLLDRVGLAAARDRYPRDLSGGMALRLSVARALAVHPRVLILDEPFSALDARTKQDLMGLLTSLQYVSNFALVVVLHDLRDAHEFAERAIILDGHPAHIALDEPIRALPFAEFRRCVFDRLDSGRVQRQAPDADGVLADLRSGEAVPPSRIATCLRASGASSLRKRVVNGDAPIVLRLFASREAVERRFGIVLARSVREPQVESALAKLWEEEQDVDARFDLIYTMLGRGLTDPELARRAIATVQDRWDEFRAYLLRWHDGSAADALCSAWAHFWNDEPDLARRRLYFLESASASAALGRRLDVEALVPGADRAELEDAIEFARRRA